MSLLPLRASQSEVFDLFRRWRDEETRLRVDAELGVIAFSLEVVVYRVDEPLLGLRISDRGFIEFKFDTTWAYCFAAPDAAQISLQERAGGAAIATKRYEFGEVVIATRTTGSQMIFLEIVKEVA